jgi:hypothetical protein
MFAWIFQISVISILFIFLIHHLICFFKNTLTVPKIKDLVKSSSKKYENIYSILKENTNNEYINTTDIHLLQPVSSMKDELKNFLKTQMNIEEKEKEKNDFENDFTFLNI